MTRLWCAVAALNANCEGKGGSGGQHNRYQAPQSPPRHCSYPHRRLLMHGDQPQLPRSLQDMGVVQRAGTSALPRLHSRGVVRCSPHAPPLTHQPRTPALLQPLLAASQATAHARDRSQAPKHMPRQRGGIVVHRCAGKGPRSHALQVSLSPPEPPRVHRMCAHAALHGTSTPPQACLDTAAQHCQPRTTNVRRACVERYRESGIGGPPAQHAPHTSLVAPVAHTHTLLHTVAPAPQGSCCHLAPVQHVNNRTPRRRLGVHPRKATEATPQQPDIVCCIRPVKDGALCVLNTRVNV